jgi:hypothetical protein
MTGLETAASTGARMGDERRQVGALADLTDEERKLLWWVNKMVEVCGTVPGYRYGTAEGLTKAYGRFHRRSPSEEQAQLVRQVREQWEPELKDGCCYFNALLVAGSGDGRLGYVEGIAGPVGTRHAWVVLDHEVVIDPTWQWLRGWPESAYLGVEIPRSLRLRHVLSGGAGGPLLAENYMGSGDHYAAHRGVYDEEIQQYQADLPSPLYARDIR